MQIYNYRGETKYPSFSPMPSDLEQDYSNGAIKKLYAGLDFSLLKAGNHQVSKNFFCLQVRVTIKKNNCTR